MLFGNTSTYVEKTLSLNSFQLSIKKHLHVCGENCFVIGFKTHFWETPPRMWRKLLRNWVQDSLLGNTSTYVEKTVWCKKHPKRNGKHLHVCGENFPKPKPAEFTMETPPRMWRKLRRWYKATPEARNTSTYVEKTERKVSRQSFCQKHLHVCGENSARIVTKFF